MQTKLFKMWFNVVSCLRCFDTTGLAPCQGSSKTFGDLWNNVIIMIIRALTSKESLDVRARISIIITLFHKSPNVSLVRLFEILAWFFLWLNDLQECLFCDCLWPTSLFVLICVWYCLICLICCLVIYPRCAVCHVCMLQLWKTCCIFWSGGIG